MPLHVPGDYPRDPLPAWRVLMDNVFHSNPNALPMPNPAFPSNFYGRPLVRFKKLRPEAVIPKYQSEGASGFDLHALVEYGSVILMPGERRLVQTGLAVELPPGYELQVRPRSGLALRHGVTILNAPGTVDCDYRGELGALLVNHGQERFVIQTGERIAQGVVLPVRQALLLEVGALSETARGAGGFGSTGR